MSVRSQKVDNLDTGDEDLSGGGLLGELRGVGVDGSVLGGLDGTTLVDGGTSVGGLGTADETLGTVHGNTSDDVLTQMLSNFENQLLVTVLGCDGVENSRELPC